MYTKIILISTSPHCRWKGLSSKASAQYEELESKLLYEGNYKAYRELLACAEPPYLPFFGLLIKDLTFMNDGNQKMVNDLVNVSKLRQIYDVILKVRNNQRHRFPYAADETPLRAAGVSAAAQLFVTLSPYSGGIPVSLFYYCSNPPALKEDQLLAISKALESQVADTGTSTLGRARGLTGLGGVPSKAKNTMLALCETRGWTTGRRGSSQSTESQESQLRRSESSSVVSYYSALDTSDGINCQSKALGNG
ncbi:ras guanine nucleotide exchange factor domain-containing protein [Cladochytrium replicatum]|nr:ras guanine nucleotide exchange factor domain-containing protein [Cladochytrium replicatum]